MNTKYIVLITQEHDSIPNAMITIAHGPFEDYDSALNYAEKQNLFFLILPLTPE